MQRELPQRRVDSGERLPEIPGEDDGEVGGPAVTGPKLDVALRAKIHRANPNQDRERQRRC
jgi:hypothetical protein